MFCGECGTQNPDTNQFCKNCGKPLAKRQTVAQPAAPAVPVPTAQPAFQPVPAPAFPYQQPGAVPVPAPALKRSRNWLGFVSLLIGIVSWVILTGILALGAIVLGIAGTILFRKATGRIGISGIIGTVLGIAAIAIIILLP